MPSKTRHETKYAGVYYIEVEGTRGQEKVFYIRYRRQGKMIEEKAGYQYRDDMTPARASKIRSTRIDGEQPSNMERRINERKKKDAEQGRWIVERLWDEYLKHKPDSNSIRTDKYRYEKFLREPFASKEPSEIIQLDVDRLRLRLLKTHSPQTVKHVLALLARIGNFGKKKGLCDGFNFVIQKPRVDNQVTEDLTTEQLKNLLDAIDNDPNKIVACMMKMALFTGMRRGELIKLKKTDIDYNRGFIWIRDPKGGKDASIPLTPDVVNILKLIPGSQSEYVFPGEDGKQRAQVYHVVNRIKRKAKLPDDFRPLHGLRHAYASMLASSGKVDMYTLQKLLTHKSPIMTQRYAHLRDETLKKASNLTGELINQALNSSK